MSGESIAAQALRDKLHEMRMAWFTHARTLAAATPEVLETYGYRNKSNAEAILDSFQRKEKELEAEIVKHERRYP